MNTLETILLTALISAEQAAPIFIHSPIGMVYLNASENFLTNLLSGLAAKGAPATPVA